MNHPLDNRLNAFGGDDPFEIARICQEAADRIEALEAALREVLDAHDKKDANEAARAALAPEPEK